MKANSKTKAVRKTKTVRKTKAHKPDPFDKYVGGRLRIARNKAGDSQHSLGARLGITFQQVGKYEKGTNRLTHSKAYDISQLYNLRIGFFTEGYSAEASHAQLAESPAAEYEAQPLSRDAMRVAQLYSAIPEAHTKKAVIGFLKLIVTKKQNENGQ